MSNIVIDFNRSCDASIFETCVQHQVPEITRDIVLLYDISDDPRTDCNSIIVTRSGQWYITRQTTSQLFDLLQENTPISYTLSKEITKKFSSIRKKIPYCFDDFLYFPIYTFSDHHHWCGYHHCIDKQKVGDTLHLYFDQSLEIILPYKYSTAILNTQTFNSLLNSNKEFNMHFFQHYPIHHSSTKEQLSITRFCQFFIPIILEYINKVSPGEIDAKTWEEVLKHFVEC